MELKQYASVLWRWSWLILLCLALGGGAGYAVSMRTVPVYEASATLLIDQARASNGAPDYNALLTGELLAKTYAELMRKRPVLEAVSANLQLGADPEDLAGRVSISPVRDTQLIALRVEDTDPQRAADTANEIVRVFSEQNQAQQASRYTDTKESLEQELARVQAEIDRTQGQLDALEGGSAPAAIAEQERLQTLVAQYRSSYATLLQSLGDVRLAEVQSTDTLSVAEAARAEPVPVRPRTLLNTLLAVLAGALLGAGIAFLIEYLDDRVRTGEQAARLAGADTIGTIGRIATTAVGGTLVTVRDPESPTAEAYRILRVNLEYSAIDRPFKTIVVTSSGPEEGKSTTSANLAVALAQSGRRVILVDTDLRRPALHRLFQVSNERGISTALMRKDEDDLTGHLVRPGVRNLALLTSGPLAPNPGELLASHRMALLVEELKSLADVVIFDTPPLLVFADAALLAGSCDGVLLVTRAGFTRIGMLAEARESLSQAGARLRGVVLNQAAQPRGGHYSYYYYARADSRSRRGPRWPFGRATGRTIRPPVQQPAAPQMDAILAARAAVRRAAAAEAPAAPAPAQHYETVKLGDLPAALAANGTAGKNGHGHG